MICDTDCHTCNRQCSHIKCYAFSWCRSSNFQHISYNTDMHLSQPNSCAACRCVIQLTNDIKANFRYRRRCMKWRSCTKYLPLYTFRPRCPEMQNFLSYYFWAVFITPCFIRKRLSHCWVTYCRSLCYGDVKASYSLLYGLYGVSHGSLSHIFV